MSNNMFEYGQKLWLIQNPYYNIFPAVFISYVSDLHDVETEAENCRVAVIKEHKYKQSEVAYRQVRRSYLFTELNNARDHILSSISFDLDDMSKRIKKKEKQLVEISNKYMEWDDYDVFLKLKEFVKNERESRKSL